MIKKCFFHKYHCFVKHQWFDGCFWVLFFRLCVYIVGNKDDKPQNYEAVILWSSPGEFMRGISRRKLICFVLFVLPSLLYVMLCRFSHVVWVYFPFPKAVLRLTRLQEVTWFLQSHRGGRLREKLPLLQSKDCALFWGHIGWSQFLCQVST